MFMRTAKMKIQKSAENYLETILMLQLANGSVRSIDVANELNFSKPSVSVAMKRLRESGYIVVDEDGHITLTESGDEIARAMYERHTIISKLLMHMGVSEEIAVEDACKIEHEISDEAFAKMREYCEKVTK